MGKESVGMGVRTSVWLLGIAVAAAALYGAVVAGRDAPLRPDPNNAPLVALGKLTYQQHCASCHGANLEGQPDWRERKPDGRLPAPPHDAEGHTWHHSDEQLVTMVRDGMAALAPPGYETDMPAFGDTLSEREIVAVIAFIKSTWPPAARERQARISAQASR
ncbi:MAG TPA: cytochrome c [Azospirillum sp.]|nr:cytochrome c [Azospirillum sp.]